MQEQTVKSLSERQERMMGVAMRVITGVNLWLLARTRGRIGWRFLGTPVLLLTTVGRRSGESRTLPLFYFQEGEQLVLVASHGGTTQNPGWYRNLERNPQVVVQIAGGPCQQMLARTASAAEAREFWPKLISMFWKWDDFQQRSRRTFPVVILSPPAAAESSDPTGP
jgi:deazaflavin-dependent oxidoreductase (nitroreductase family)